MSNTTLLEAGECYVLITCIECRRRISDKAESCPHCSASREAFLGAEISCAECGTRIRRAYDACSNCGAPIKLTGEEAPTSGPIAPAPELASTLADAPIQLLPPVTSPTQAPSFVWSAAARPLGGLYGALRIALFFQIGLALVSLVHSTASILFLNAIAEGLMTDAGEIERVGGLVGSVGLLLAIAVWVVFIWGVVMYCRFVFRGMKNLRLSSATGVTIGPFWAAGWNFVPIFCLWKPLQAMRQIWRSSHDPERARAPIPAAMGWWWALSLIGNFVPAAWGAISYAGVRPGYYYDPGFLTAVSLLLMASSVVIVISQFLLLSVIRGVTSVQDKALGARRVS